MADLEEKTHTGERPPLTQALGVGKQLHMILNRIACLSILGVLMLAGMLAGSTAHACNSMANDRWGLWTLLGLPILLPMAVLIPLEMAILRNIGDLEFEYKKAYLYCLPAKIISLLVLSLFYMVVGQLSGLIAFIGGELAYSMMHFLISLFILGKFFRSEIKNEVVTAALISTAIPWAYTAGIPLTLILFVAMR